MSSAGPVQRCWPPCPYTLLQENTHQQVLLISVIKILKNLLSVSWLTDTIAVLKALPGFVVVLGWSAGLSVQLSRLLEPGRGSAVEDALVGIAMVISEAEGVF